MAISRANLSFEMNTESDEENVGILGPVSRSRHGSVTAGGSYSSSSTNQYLLRSTCLSLLFALFAWYYPRYIIENESTIETKVPPYQKTKSGDDVILDFNLNHPLIDPPTIPSELLKLSSLWLPLVIIASHAAWYGNRRKQIVGYTLAALGGFFMAIGLSEGSTVVLKFWIQRRRPNFYNLCAFDKTLLKCTADLQHIREANFSFPSGHSSLSCSSMTYIVWYFLGYQRRGRNNNNNNPLLNAMIAIVPWGWTIFVAASRWVKLFFCLSSIYVNFSLVFGGVHLWWLICTLTLSFFLFFLMGLRPQTQDCR